MVSTRTLVQFLTLKRHFLKRFKVYLVCTVQKVPMLFLFFLRSPSGTPTKLFLNDMNINKSSVGTGLVQYKLS